MDAQHIKICGLTTLEQALACIELGIGWLGFNCYPKSKRYLPADAIHHITSKLPSGVRTVGVFVNESQEKLQSCCTKSGLEIAQLHGDEDPEYCQSLEVPHIKAFRVSPKFQVETLSKYPSEWLLLDTYHPQHYGGTGKTFDWSIASKATQYGKVFLAGGITPKNVAKAIQTTQPFGIDICGGVESQPGIKNLTQVQELIQNAQPH